MDKNEQKERLKKALQKEKEANEKIGGWADVIGFSGIIIGTIVSIELNEIFGGLICLGTLVIWMKMKDDSKGN